MLKAVIDCNVWVSSLLNPGTARKVTDSFEAAFYQVAYSQELLDELTDVLSRPDIAALIPQQNVERILSEFTKKAIFVKLESVPRLAVIPKTIPTCPAPNWRIATL